MTPPDRRELLGAVAALGVGTAAFHRAAAAQAAGRTDITPEMVRDAEWVAGVTLSDDDRQEVAVSLTRTLRAVASARSVPLPNDVVPPLVFRPDAGAPPTGPMGEVSAPQLDVKRPASDDDLAFLPVTHLSSLLRAKKVSSVELTRLYLARLRKYDPALKCVVTLTEELALKQARRADEELAAGRPRGPLHGVPWGAKDLIAVPGYPTTWGAAEYKDQRIDTLATVARKLDEAGAVLVAKLSLGALAYNDVWFGGRTNNPWNPAEGSSGSSAGSACAVAAGLVGFALGSETLGSIVSPCSRCGATGVRPTFGRVSRHGCMSLAWSMDKVGPIARSVADCALVVGAVRGADPLDPSSADRPFAWPCPKPLKSLRVGYTGNDGRAELDALRALGVQLVPIELPTAKANAIAGTILNAEAGAAFDELTRTGTLNGIGNLWPTPFRAAQFVAATDYLRANRLRSLLMRDMAEVMATVNLYVGGNDLSLTNLTGHPTVVLPNGFTRRGGADEVPTAITFTGRLWGEAELLAVAAAYQEAAGHHRRRPPQDKWAAP